MAINKIVINGRTKIDLTDDTAVAADVRAGKTFHNKKGELETGTLNFGYTLKEFMDGMEALTIDDGTIVTDWDNVTTLPDYFYVGGGNGKLETVRFDKVITIGIAAFAGATGLKNAIFPSCTHLGALAFASHTGNSYGEMEGRTLLTGDVYFPNLIKSGANAFEGSMIESISLPKYIGGAGTNHSDMFEDSTTMFMNCTNLKHLDLPSLKYAGRGGFIDGCSSLEELHLPELLNTGYDFAWNCTSLRVVDLPKCEYMGPTVFKNCPNIRSINLPKLKSIPPLFLSYSPLVEEVNLPEVTELLSFSGFGTYQNYFCPYQYSENVEIDYNNKPMSNIKKLLLPKLDIDFGSVSNDSFPLLFGSGPECLPYLEEVNLDSLQCLAKSETNLTYMQTFDCLNIKKISLNSCKAIHSAAFVDCEIEEVTLPACKYLGNGVFINNPIRKADLHVIESMYNAFQSWNGKEPFKLIIRTPNKVCELLSVYAFDYNDNGTCPGADKLQIYVPDNFVNQYKTAANWNIYADRIYPLSQYIE